VGLHHRCGDRGEKFSEPQVVGAWWGLICGCVLLAVSETEFRCLPGKLHHQKGKFTRVDEGSSTGAAVTRLVGQTSPFTSAGEAKPGQGDPLVPGPLLFDIGNLKRSRTLLALTSHVFLLEDVPPATLHRRGLEVLESSLECMDC
jgi:hypothetical protein